MTTILLDCDTGIDDALALLTAAFAPGVDLVGVGCTWGNIDVDQAARNTHQILSLIGRGDVPVARGAEGPLDGSEAVFAQHVHGDDGAGNVADRDHVPTLASETAVEQLLGLSREHDDLHIVAVGPMTNLALALQADPEVAHRVAHVTMMGGAALSPGNITAAAEANIWHDAEAAAAVFEAAWPVTMVGLDVTMDAILTEEHRLRLTTGGPAARLCAAMLDHYYDFYTMVTGQRCAANHDALAVAVAVGLVDVTLSPVVEVDVDTTHGPSRGRTVADLRGVWAGYPPVKGARHRVVLEIEPGFEDRMIDLILTGDPAESPA